MKKTAITLTLLASLLFGGQAMAAPSLSVPGIIQGLNAVRAGQHRAPLKENATLDWVAQLKANDLCRRDYWAHTLPDGKPFTYYFDRAGYRYDYAGENLAQGYDTTSALITGWVNSPEHYANMISADYTQTGAAFVNCPAYQGQTDVTIAVNEFGRPEPLASAPGPVRAVAKTVSLVPLAAIVTFGVLLVGEVAAIYWLRNRRGQSRGKRKAKK